MTTGMHDVVVVGGGYAGMSAALQLLRARRRVLVVDAGARRNRFAAEAHGFLAMDGADPADIAAIARRQLAAYPTLSWIDARVEGVTGEVDDFVVNTSDGGRHAARRVLLATGVADALPEVDGLAERWGRAAFHCPYCHGYELDGGRVGIVGSGPLSLHQAELLTEWGEVTLLANDRVPLDDAARAKLVARGVAIEETPVARIAGHADVVLADGRVLPFAGLFVATRTSPADAVGEALGCALEDTPMGTQLRIDAEHRTSVPGVFACGDAARVPHSLALAVAHGAMAGAMLHRSLVWPESLVAAPAAA